MTLILQNQMLIFYVIQCIFFISLQNAVVEGILDMQNNASKYEFHINTFTCEMQKPKHCDTLSFGSQEYYLLPNKSVYLYPYKKSLDECFYSLVKGKVIICKSLFKEEIEVLTIPCGVQLSLCISVFSVFLPLFFSMLTEDVRDLIHVNWRGLILSVFFFHFLLQTLNLDKVTDVPEFKYTFPSLMHFFTLVLLSWMTIMSHDGMMMSETAANSNASYMELMKNFRGHILSISTSMILLITVTLLMEVFGIIPPNFKPISGDFCWLTQRTLLLFFTGPVLAFSLINFLNFLSTYIYFTRQGNACEGPLLVLKKNYLVHFKLFVIVDITWLLGVLVFLAESEWLWKVFVCVFMIQEAFIIIVPFNKQLEKWALKHLSGE